MLLLIPAALLLAFGGFCVFGLPYMMTGPRVFDEFAENYEQQVFGGALLTAAIALVCVPFASAALISPTCHGQVFASAFLGLGWA